MTVVLDNPLIVGKTVVAALVRNSINEYRSARHMAISGDRRPVAVLIQSGDELAAFTPQGEPMEHEEVEILCPGAIKKLAAL